MNTRFKQLGNFNIMDLFRKPAQQQQQQQQPDPSLEPKLGADGKPLPGQDIDPTTGKLRKKQTSANSPENIDPNNKSTDPLDTFKDLWHPNTQAGDGKPPAFSLDPETVKKITEQLSFAPTLTPELLKKFQEGDAETINGVLNSTGRQAYSMLMQHLPALTDKFISARLEHDRSGLGRSVRQELTTNSLSKLASKSPVLKQQLDTIVSQLYEKFPDATPEWVAEQATGYFTNIAKLVNPEAFKASEAEERQTAESKDIDWAAYITGQQTKKAP